MKRKTIRMPRMSILAIDRRELVAFLESMRRAPDVVRDLETLLALYKRRPRRAPKEVTDEFEFALIWSDLQIAGLVDAEGGAEYRRVYAEWLAANKQRPLSLFIPRRVVPAIGATARKEEK